MVFQQRSRAAFGEIFPLEAFHDKQAVKALDKMGTCASIGFMDALVKAFGHATKAQREPSEHDSRGDEHLSYLPSEVWASRLLQLMPTVIGDEPAPKSCL